MIEPRQKALKRLWDIFTDKEQFVCRLYSHLHVVKKRTYTKTMCHVTGDSQFILIKYSWKHKDEYFMTKPKNWNYKYIEALANRIDLKHKINGTSNTVN